MALHALAGTGLLFSIGPMRAPSCHLIGVLTIFFAAQDAQMNGGTGDGVGACGMINIGTFSLEGLGLSLKKMD